MKIAVIGGGIAGLSAATFAGNEDTTLYDNRGFEDRNIKPWGGGIADYRTLPRSYDAPGILRRIDKVAAINESSRVDIRTQYGVIIQRDTFEEKWGKTLEHNIQVEEKEITESRFYEICDCSDLVIDATGVNPISQELGLVDGSSLRGNTVSAIVKGDFREIFPTPFVRGYQSGYSWVNPLTETKAVVGLGTYEHEDSESTEPIQLLHKVADQFDVTAERILRGPDRFSVPIIGGRKLSSLEYTLSGAKVRLVGDAASLANGVTGTGLSRAARSGGEAVTTPLNNSYPENLRQSAHISRSRQLVHRYTTLDQIVSSVSRVTDSVRYEPLFEQGPLSGVKHVAQQALN